MAVKKSFVKKLIDMSPKIHYARRHDYVALKKGKFYYIYRRLYFEYPWQKIVIVNTETNEYEYTESGCEKLGADYFV